QALLDTGKTSPALTSAKLAATLAPADLQHQELLLNCLEANQEWPTALEVRQQLLKRRPGTPDSADWHALAGCALQAQVPAEAISAAEKALKIDAQDGIAHALYGAALLQQNDAEGALSHFSTATELAPHKAEPWLALAEAYSHSNDPVRAFDTLRSGSLAAPHSARLQLALGKASLDAGAPSQALGAFRKSASLIQENNPEDQPIGSVYGMADLHHEIAFYLGETLRQLGHLDEARQVFSAAYQETNQRKPSDTRLAHAYAKTLLGLNATAEAIRPLQDVVAGTPADADPYVDLARSLLELGGPRRDYAAQSIEYLQQALAINPNYAEAQGLLGEAMEANHQPTRALSAYQKALETALIDDPAWKARLQHGVGRAALQNGQAETALVSLREAAQLEPLNPGIQQTLASAYLELGMYADSLNAARTALQLNPAQTQVMAWFAQHARSLLSASDGQINALPEAGKALAQAIQSDPSQIELYIDLGQLHLENSNQAAALRAFIEAADRSSQVSLSLAQVLLLARELRHLGEAEKAAILLTQSLQEYPGSDDYTPDQDRPETQLWYELSITQLQLGSQTAAIQALDKAILCQPDNPTLLVKKADLLVECDRLADASSLLQRLLSEAPEDIALYIKAGFVLRGLGEYTTALAYAEQAISLVETGTPGSMAARAHSLAAQLGRSLLMPDKALAWISSVDPDTDEQT
ncbi:MAG TPA: tetratricopeptide repeat protein, partial [Anaerolineales bacterium]|nr:tetratricopeptide repeat protein [Anaerolineales bacterium]